MSSYGGSLNTDVPMVWSSASKGNCPKKRALLCGVTYDRKKYKLRGTVNDVKEMRALLINKFGYPAHCIRVLTEFEPDKAFHPTKKNIENSLKWLVDGCQAGDRLVFYFSGHGVRQPDFKNDELDGFDETICPVDFMKEGMIFDNDINIAIVRPLKQGVTLHAIVDACNSGNILDLEYVYDQKCRKWRDNKPYYKGTAGGLAISLSACEDYQMAADTTAFTGKTTYGALTNIFIEVMKQNPNVTYRQLLEFLTEQLSVNSAPNCLNRGKLTKLFVIPKVSQMPVLSSSSCNFNIDSRVSLNIGSNIAASAPDHRWASSAPPRSLHACPIPGFRQLAVEQSAAYPNRSRKMEL